jgi:hypothetical protein
MAAASTVAVFMVVVGMVAIMAGMGATVVGTAAMAAGMAATVVGMAAMAAGMGATVVGMAAGVAAVVTGMAVCGFPMSTRFPRMSAAMYGGVLTQCGNITRSRASGRTQHPARGHASLIARGIVDSPLWTQWGSQVKDLRDSVAFDTRECWAEGPRTITTGKTGSPVPLPPYE